LASAIPVTPLQIASRSSPLLFTPLSEALGETRQPRWGGETLRRASLSLRRSRNVASAPAQAQGWPVARGRSWL